MKRNTDQPNDSSQQTNAESSADSRTDSSTGDKGPTPTVVGHIEDENAPDTGTILVKNSVPAPCKASSDDSLDQSNPLVDTGVLQSVRNMVYDRRLIRGRCGNRHRIETDRFGTEVTLTAFVSHSDAKSAANHLLRLPTDLTTITGVGDVQVFVEQSAAAMFHSLRDAADTDTLQTIENLLQSTDNEQTATKALALVSDDEANRITEAFRFLGYGEQQRLGGLARIPKNRWRDQVVTLKVRIDAAKATTNNL